MSACADKLLSILFSFPKINNTFESLTFSSPFGVCFSKKSSAILCSFEKDKKVLEKT